MQKNQEEKLTDCRKSDMDIYCVKPHIWAHSNKVPTSIVFKRFSGLSVFSQVQVLRSRQINHIRQDGTIFQILERSFPKPFLHAKKREATVFSITNGNFTNVSSFTPRSGHINIPFTKVPPLNRSKSPFLLLTTKPY